MSNEWFSTLRTIEFKENVQMLLQDKGGKLRMHVDTDRISGAKEARVVEQFGEMAGQIVTERFGETPNMALPTDARWIVPRHIEAGKWIDRFDQRSVRTDVQSPIVQATVNAIRRLEDNEILSKFFSTALTGETSASNSTAFDTDNVVGIDVGGDDTGLNHSKIRKGLEILMGNEADIFDASDPVCMIIGEAEWNALFGESFTTSADYVNGRPIETGRLPGLYGVNMIPFSEARLRNFDGGTGFYNATATALELPMWKKSGMYTGIWEDLEAEILKLNSRKGIPAPYACQTQGTTRTEEAKVVKIQCYRAS